jgi:hypothetical protein
MNQRKHLPRITVSEDTCTLSRSLFSTLPQHSSTRLLYTVPGTGVETQTATVRITHASHAHVFGSAIRFRVVRRLRVGGTFALPPVFWFLRADGTGRPEANESTDQGHNPVVPLYRCTSRRCTEESSTRRCHRVLREAGGTDDRRAHACRSA